MANIYNFPKDIKIKYIFNWWEGLLARLFGDKYHDISFPYELIAYHYKGKLYITKYGRI